MLPTVGTVNGNTGNCKPFTVVLREVDPNTGIVSERLLNNKHLLQSKNRSKSLLLLQELTVIISTSNAGLTIYEFTLIYLTRMFAVASC